MRELSRIQMDGIFGLPLRKKLQILMGVYIQKLRGGSCKMIAPEKSKLALHEGAVAAHIGAQRKKKQKGSHARNHAVEKARAVFRHIMRAEPDRVAIDQKGRRTIWHDGMEFRFTQSRKEYSSLRQPHRWFLRGICPDCGAKCWSIKIRNRAELGSMLETFVPLSVERCKRLWGGPDGIFPHRCGQAVSPTCKEAVCGPNVGLSGIDCIAGHWYTGRYDKVTVNS